MISWFELIRFVHLTGLALGMGAATVKLILLLKCKSAPSFVLHFLQVTKPITLLIVLGLILLTLSGIAWIVLLGGFGLMSLLTVKLVLVAAIWTLGPYIDHVVSPRFAALAPASGEPPSPEFVRAQARYLRLETTATLLFYAITVIGVLL